MAHAPIKYVEKGLSYVAGGLWHGYAAREPADAEGVLHAQVVRQAAAEVVGEDEAACSGFPRETDSLCPTCVREARQEILDGTQGRVGPR